MKYEKYFTKIILLIVFVFMISFIFAQECNENTVGQSWETEDGLEMCTCYGSSQEGYELQCNPIDPFIDQDPIPDDNLVNDVNLSDISSNKPDQNQTVKISSTDIATVNNLNINSCSNKIKEIDKRIKNISKKYYKDYILLKKKIALSESKIKSLTKEYFICKRNKGIIQENVNSNISGNVVFTNNVYTKNYFKNKFKNISKEDKLDVSSDIYLPNDLRIDDIEDTTSEDYIENVFDIADINIMKKQYKDLNDYVDLTISETQYEKCNSIKNKIEVEKSKILTQLLKIDKIYMNNKDDFKKLKKLQNEKRTLLKKCFRNFSISSNNNVQSTAIISECKVPEELIETRKNLLAKIKSFRELHSGVIERNTDDAKNYLLLIKRLKEINRKIDVIKKTCSFRKKSVNNIEDLCAEKVKILKKIDDLSEKIKNAKTRMEIYKLKNKISSLKDRFKKTKCVNFTSLNKENTDISVKSDKLLKSKIFEECVENLSSKENMSKDDAIYNCKVKYINNKDTLKAEIKNLKLKIEEQNKIIRNLKSQVNNFRAKFKSANSVTDKINIIKENPDDLANYTLKLLDRLNVYLDNVRTKIEFSDLSDEKKQVIEDNIDKLKAEDDIIKEDISNSNTPEELRAQLINARNLGRKVKIATSIYLIRRNINNLENIIDKYPKNKYNSAFNKSLNELKDTINTLEIKSLDDLKNSDIVDVKNKYMAIKSRIKKYLLNEVKK